MYYEEQRNLTLEVLAQTLKRELVRKKLFPSSPFAIESTYSLFFPWKGTERGCVSFYEISFALMAIFCK